VVEDVRVARPQDYDAIVAVVDDWWGRPVSHSLPRLFLDHFWSTSLVAEDTQGLAGFLVAFVSPDQPRCGYVHFAGVRPDLRRSGLARRLYGEFTKQAVRQGCTGLRAITAPGNVGSIRFHRGLGFEISGPEPDYNGADRPMVTLTRQLSPATVNLGEAPLRSSPLVGFVGVSDLARAGKFYGETLGLLLVDEAPFALVADLNGTMLRITAVDRVIAAPYTILGWQVLNITSMIDALAGRGVTFLRYEGMGQDNRGVWTAPEGAKVAWFSDPDGNTLSLTQRAEPG
jgi:GNAT superfamily N-acetyltransferase/catechol 2,3-dioxygenase-like lactoylglutathione lyase family enzyme